MAYGHDALVDALMKTRKHNAPSGQGLGRIKNAGKSGGKGTKVAPAHGQTKKPPHGQYRKAMKHKPAK